MAARASAMGSTAAFTGAVSVGALSDSAGVSGNHLATQFKYHLGVTPKRVARIYRFARLILSVDALRPVAWSELGRTTAANQYTVLDLPKRLMRLKQDPWQDIGRIKQALPDPRMITPAVG